MKVTKLIIGAIVLVVLTTSGTCKKGQRCPTVNGKADWSKTEVKK